VAGYSYGVRQRLGVAAGDRFLVWFNVSCL
jgi:hypothetical protein